MEPRALGRDGPLVTPLFLGTWPLGGGMGPVARSTAIATIRRALDLGVTSVDTAEGYGDAEELLGEAIPSSDRPRVFIATKVSFGPYTADRVLASVEQSLRRMRTDHVDLVQLHFYPDDVPLDEAMDALRAVRDRGLTRWIGLSNFTRDQLERAVDRVPIQSLQAPLNLYDRAELSGSIDRCRELGIGVICHSSLAKGLLSGQLTASSVFSERDERRNHPRFQPGMLPRYVAIADQLRRLAANQGMTLVEAAVAWVLAQPGVSACIAGPVSPAELDDQVRGATMTLDEAFLTEMARIADGAPAIGHGTPTASPSLTANG